MKRKKRLVVGAFSDRPQSPQDREVTAKSRKKKPRVRKLVSSLRGLRDVDNNNPADSGSGVG